MTDKIHDLFVCGHHIQEFQRLLQPIRIKIHERVMSYLEPDDVYGYGYLEAIRDVFLTQPDTERIK